MTQGYGVGSHIPANVLGAVDLAVDAGGDGYAEATSSWNVPIVATHDGIANVWLGSELGGNQVSVSDYHRGWRTNYAHMSVVLVESGQYVTAGSVIGLVGDSGKSTGPHLDYQVWIGGVNVNPTSLVAPCWSIE
jgi:murein DD-endopeptidase MepM/ murein hydrolase activator NlpD